MVISQYFFIDNLFGDSNPLFKTPEWTVLAVPHVFGVATRVSVGDKVTFIFQGCQCCLSNMPANLTRIGAI